MSDQGPPRRIPRRTIPVATLVLAAVATVEGVQHIVPRINPADAGLPPAYDFFDLGPAPAVACACVPHPFALSSYRPGWASAYSSGPAVPLGDPPLSDADRERNRDWYAQEQRDIPAMMNAGLAGSGNDSLAVANHLGLYNVVVGPDERVEKEAVRWLTRAAEQGHRDACRLLARRYARGLGVAQDYAIAAYWFDQAARKDDPISMVAIGVLRAAGRGVEQSWTEAMRWWRRAETRSPYASRYLGDAYACGAGVEEDHERAAGTYRQAVDPSAQIQLAHLYLRGCARGEDKDAVAIFRSAANQGSPDAQVELSALLLDGRGGEAEPLEAYRWARIAELRLPPGELKARAGERAAAAARLVPPIVITYEDRMIAGMIESASKPMR
jgi:TPR repeat protein